MGAVRESSPCIEHLGGDQYRCRNTGIVMRVRVLPIHCSCGGEPMPPARPPRTMDDLEQLVAQHAGRPLEERDLVRLEACGSCPELFACNHCRARETEGCIGTRFASFASRLTSDACTCELWEGCGRLPAPASMLDSRPELSPVACSSARDQKAEVPAVLPVDPLSSSPVDKGLPEDLPKTWRRR